MKTTQAISNQSAAAAEPSKWWKFKITDEQARAWQNGDINAAKQFYEENEKLLRAIAGKYKYGYANVWGFQIALYKQAQNFYTFDDMLNQIYADLPDYRFFDGKSLIQCICKSCIFVAAGGYGSYIRSEYCFISLDKPVGKDKDGATLADFIASKLTIDDELQRENSTAMSKAFEKTLEQIAYTLYPSPQDELKRLAFIRRF